MTDQEIKKILAEDRIPEPDHQAREKAVESAVAEFSAQREVSEKKIKGFKHRDRPTGTLLSILTYLGECTMKKRYVIPSAITACLIVAVFGVSQLMELSQPVKPSEIVLLQEGKPGKRVLSNEVVQETIEQKPTDAKVASPMTEPESEAVEEVAVLKVEGAGSIEQKKTYLSRKEIASPRPVHKVMQKQAKVRVMASRIPEPVIDDAIGIQQPGGKDRFEEVKKNPVKSTADEPVSTFSVDVDTASYAFVRKKLNQGILPPKSAVRIEELINYFDYNYELPTNRKAPFKPTVAVYPTPWNPDTKLLHIGIRGYDIVPEKKPKANLVFLLDVSGSMNAPDKLPLLKNAFRMLVDNLKETDTVSIVVYAGAAGTVLEPTTVKEKGKILSALGNLRAGGSTAGGEGIRQAYALAETHFVKDGVNRIILATDGDFNVGITNTEELKGFVERKRKTGIFLSVIGFGQGNYNDALMQKLAQNGNGNAAYIDNLNEARKVLVEEANAVLFTIAKDVKIQVEFNPARVAEYRLIGYETRMLKREDFKNDKVDAGDIGSGHRVTAIYEIAEPGSKGRLLDDLRYGSKTSGKAGKSAEYAFLKIRYKAPDSDKSQLMTTPVDNRHDVATLKQLSPEIRFAAAVAAYGQLLREDPYTKTFSFDDVVKLALSSRGDDPFGLRSEFINLVRLAKTARAMPENQ